MNRFKDNVTDPDFWLRLLYTLLFALAWQVVELLLGVILVLQIGFRLFTGQPHGDLAGLGNSLAQYAWQIGRYVSGASEVKPWPFDEWPAADAQWQPVVPQGPVTVDPQTASPAAAAPPVDPVPPTAPVAPAASVAPAAPVVAADSPVEAAPAAPVVEPDAPIVHPTDEPAELPEPPIVLPADDSGQADDTAAERNPGDRPLP